MSHRTKAHTGAATEFGHPRPLLWIPLLFLACAPPPSEPLDAFPAELEEAVAAFYAAVDAGDADGVIALFHDNALVLPDGGPPRLGKEAVSESWRAGAGGGFRLRDISVLQAGRSGDLAFRVNQYSWSMAGEGDGRDWFPTKNVHIWKRQADGSWKLLVDLWNENPEGSQGAASSR